MRPLTKIQLAMLRAADTGDGVVVPPRYVRGTARTSVIASLRAFGMVTEADPPRITPAGRARLNAGGICLTRIERAALIRLRYAERIRAGRDADPDEEAIERLYAPLPTPPKVYDRLVSAGLARLTPDGRLTITILGRNMIADTTLEEP